MAACWGASRNRHPRPSFSAWSTAVPWQATDRPAPEHRRGIPQNPAHLIVKKQFSDRGSKRRRPATTPVSRHQGLLGGMAPLRLEPSSGPLQTLPEASMAPRLSAPDVKKIDGAGRRAPGRQAACGHSALPRPVSLPATGPNGSTTSALPPSPPRAPLARRQSAEG